MENLEIDGSFWSWSLGLELVMASYKFYTQCHCLYIAQLQGVFEEIIICSGCNIMYPRDTPAIDM